MKKIGILLLIILALFIGGTYLSVNQTRDDFRTCEIVSLSDLDSMEIMRFDSVQIAASTLYKGDFIKTIMQGDNYREVWAEPIRVPVGRLGDIFGSRMEILEEGGGKQTHSLKIKGEDDIIYTLRSVTKDPEPLVPEWAFTLGLENIVIDGISAQHPYAALAASQLAESAGILHTHPKLYFIPKQESLNHFNSKFGNRLFLLEYETENDKNWTSFEDIEKFIDTEDLQKLKAELKDEVVVDKALLILARLFDILIGDWDRHSKQWGWAIQSKGDQRNAIPLPADRDNAFFTIDGIIPLLLKNDRITPHMQSFENEVEYIPGLVMDFDVYFLKNVTSDLFEEQAAELQNRLTDEKIEQAFQIWPFEIQKLSAKSIIEKIKFRRAHLKEYALAFHCAIVKRDWLTEPLKGSEIIKNAPELTRCFDCY